MIQKLPLRLMVGCVLAMTCLCASASALHSAVLPEYEHFEKSIRFAYLATMINDSDTIAKNCRIEMDKDLPARLTFQASKPFVSRWEVENNVAVDIPPRKAQHFTFQLEFYGQLKTKTRISYPQFICDDHPAAKRVDGINSLDFSDFTLEEVRWLTANQVDELADPIDDLPRRRSTLADLNPEQASLISQLNPTQWGLGRGPLNMPLFLRGDDLGDINPKELLADPEKETLRYLTALGPLTNADTRTTIVIDYVQDNGAARNSYVGFSQTVNGVKSEEEPSVIQFTEGGTVVRVNSKIAGYDDLPGLVIDAQEAMVRAQNAVKDKYLLWFLWLAEAKGISKSGNIKKLFWYNRRRTKVIIGWEVGFLNYWPGTAGRGFGFHTVAVDGTSGETRLRGKPRHRYSQ